MNIKSKRSRACAITPEVRKEVMDRDCGCIVCGTTANLETAHYISRAYGGLGIKENLVILCRKHHRLTDQTIHRKQYLEFIEKYLKSRYPNWNIKDLIYKKGE